MKRRFVMHAVIALALVWSAVAATSRLVDASIPTAGKLLAYIGSEPFASEPRARVVERVASDYVRLPFLQKRELRAAGAGGEFESFLAGLTNEEKSDFIERSLPRGFRELLDGFGRMDERERVKNLERSRRELLENIADSPAKLLMETAGPALIKQISEKGLGTFYDSLPPDAKLQLLPMIEQMQNNARQLKD